MDEQHDIERAEQARGILEHPIFSEAFDELERTYIEAWRHSRHDATEERERLWIALNSLEVIKVHLESVIAGGTLARADLETLILQKDLTLN